MNHLVQYLLAGGMATAIFVIYFFRKRRAPFYKMFQEGVQCENNGHYADAADIYALLLDECKKTTFKDKPLMEQAENRLKTMRLKLEEQNSFLQRLEYSW
jgi:hypothetical protein